MIKLEDINIKNFGIFYFRDVKKEKEDFLRNIKTSNKGDFCKCPFPHRAPIYYSVKDKYNNKKLSKKIIDIRNCLKIKRKNPRIEKNEYPNHIPDQKIEDYLEEYRNHISYKQLKNYDNLPIHTLFNLKENSSSELKNSNSFQKSSHSNLQEIQIRLNSACVKLGKHIKKSPKNIKCYKGKLNKKKEIKNKRKYSISVHNIHEILHLKNKYNRKSSVNLNILKDNLNKNHSENLSENKTFKEIINEFEKVMPKKSASTINKSSVFKESKDMVSPIIVVSLSKQNINEKNKLNKSNNIKKSKIFNEVNEKKKIPTKNNHKISKLNLNKNFKNSEEKNNIQEMLPNLLHNQIENRKEEKLEILKKRFKIPNKLSDTRTFKEDKQLIKERLMKNQKEFTISTNNLIFNKKTLGKSIHTSPRTKIKHKNNSKDRNSIKETSNVIVSTSPRNEIDDYIAKSEYLKFLGIV